MSRPRCNFLIDKHEVILKVTAMKNHSKTMLHADFFLSQNVTNVSKLYKTSSSHVEQRCAYFNAFFKKPQRRSFLYLYVIEINAFQHNTVTRIITSLYIWQTTCIPQQSYTVELMFTEVQMHNVGEKAKSMLITRKIPKQRVRRHAFVTRNTQKAHVRSMAIKLTKKCLQYRPP